eukprot:scaffold12959_cov116-Isochrysis_galbana.AAC.17
MVYMKPAYNPPGPATGLPQVSQTPTDCVLASARVPRDHLGSAPGARVGLAALSEPRGVPSGPECQSAARDTHPVGQSMKPTPGQVSADPASARLWGRNFAVSRPMSRVACC